MRRKFGIWKLRRLLRNTKRIKKVHNLDTAKSIGIVFDATLTSQFELVQNFYKSLKKPDVEVRVLGYSKMKELSNQYLFKKDFQFFLKKDLNWYHRPVHRDVDQFIHKPFDILIDLSISSEYHFRYIVALTPAQFKVGHFTEEHSYYDMMIDIKKKPTLDYLIDQFGHYLSIINKPYITVH
jgi:hypothetical protein